MRSNPAALRGLWLAIILLTGLFSAVITGAIFRAAGADLPAALGAGGATFLGLTSLGLAAWRFVTGGPDDDIPPATKPLS